ncbi:basic-leucine zipper (bZIP) transcription factor [Pochonia chlamydosporia 170]|uniref:Basic-leucine zipper (BZIP) transcription factor n=1 Tax=Pochonia chlamydosporia 170 TaxID=1380566 RepID=A0A179F6A4_METCM|nr:basic-leucine zipper (bZIP) transcription factor [Pochonia chlamydosporia 170]OAQ60880.2 basic-leucine zipper (bZIP) transcription factor [Pochonia chlamydosporia 170]
MAGETTVDPVLLDPCLQPLSPSPTNVYGNGTANASLSSLYSFSGFPFGPKLQPLSPINRVGEADGNRSPSRPEHQHDRSPSDPVTNPSTNPYSIASLTTPSDILSPEDISDEAKKTRAKKTSAKKTSAKKTSAKKTSAKKTSAKSKNETPAPTKSTMQLPSTEKAFKPSPKTRRQSRRETSKARSRSIAEPQEKKTRNLRQRSLERNRVAASRCRKRKKQWVDNLEQKKSGLESIHHELQTEYMRLLNELSLLKGHVINHARCRDANINVWINNEASKYARTLQSANRMNSIHSIQSVDGKSVDRRL